jgi:hypothetical protein
MKELPVHYKTSSYGALLLWAFLASNAAAGPRRPVGVPPQKFVCDVGYDQKLCSQQMAVFRKALARYPVERLGPWTWILVRSSDWNRLLRERRLHPETPALTYLPAHQTFFDEALLVPQSLRANELTESWHMGMPELLDLTIAHEFAHSLCVDVNEARTVQRSRVLRRGGSLSCSAPWDQQIEVAGIPKRP